MSTAQQQRGGAYANAGWKMIGCGDDARLRHLLDNDEELPGALTRDADRRRSRSGSAPALNGDYGKKVKT